MPIVTGVRFKDSGKTYHFDPHELTLASGDWVVVDTVRGPELGRVAMAPVDLPPDQLFGELKPVLRRATSTDLDQLHQLQQHEDDALRDCVTKVREHNLPMSLVKAEYNFDGSRLTFYFTADKRVDFRALVRDLARTFRTRIELRQIGPRDEAKLLGGVGPCGRLLCCSTFLPDFARVSIKMAKDQDLPLTPSKISGVCGRLLCCLSYEHEQYVEIKSELPQRGDWVQTAHGPGEVIAVNVVKENVTVDLGDGNTVECTAKEIMDVRRQVAAEAQSRNTQGITPVAQYGLTALDHADDLLAGDDPHVLHALQDVHDMPPQPLVRKPAARPAPVRADAALGESLAQALRPTTPPHQAQEQRPRPPRGERPRAEQQAARQPAPSAAAPAPLADDAAAQQARRRKRRKRNGKG